MEKKQINLTMIETDNYSIFRYYDKPIKVPYNNGETGKRGQAKDPLKSLYSAVNRAKKAIFGYVIANEWDLWGTFTLDGKKVDRYNLDETQKKLTVYLMNKRARDYQALRWLIVPERHKDGAWHFHLLLSGLPDNELRDTGIIYGATGRRIYNWVDYEEKFGFNAFIDIRGVSLDEMYRIANYLTKYMTKDLGAVRYNKKKYWVSRGLKKPNKSNTLVNYSEYLNLLNILDDSNDIIRESQYYIKDRETGEICNMVTETVKINLPF